RQFGFDRLRQACGRFDDSREKERNSHSHCAALLGSKGWGLKGGWCANASPTKKGCVAARTSCGKKVGASNAAADVVHKAATAILASTWMIQRRRVRKGQRPCFCAGT